jgi:hypothetical protein
VYEKSRLVIGSSSLILDDWQWEQYDKPMSSGTLWPNSDGQVVFSAFQINTGCLDIIEMTQELVAPNELIPCQLFVPVEMQVQEISKFTSPVSIDVHPITVTQTPWTPQFLPGRITSQINLRTYNCHENPICGTESELNYGGPAGP